jgi:hypothetical protein
MKKFLFILMFALLAAFPVFTQAVDGKEINDRELEWSDFVGEVDKSSKWDAYTGWITTYSYPRPTFEGDKVRVQLSVRLFLKNSSWVKSGKETDRLLNHERGHYKIGQICVKQITETVNSTAFDRTNYRKEIDALYWQIIEQCKALEKQYDNETNHYLNQAQQKAWDKKLNDLSN